VAFFEFGVCVGGREKEKRREKKRKGKGALKGVGRGGRKRCVL
jgi:hypothetical protein